MSLRENKESQKCREGAFKGRRKVLRYQNYSTLYWRRTYAASSSRWSIFHNLRVIPVTVYALRRTVLIDYDLFFSDLLCLRMALCASHVGMTPGQRQVGLVMVKR